MMFLDARHHVIELEDPFFGTSDGARVYSRDVVRRALHHNAVAVILVQNSLRASLSRIDPSKCSPDDCGMHWHSWPCVYF